MRMFFKTILLVGLFFGLHHEMWSQSSGPAGELSLNQIETRLSQVMTDINRLNERQHAELLAPAAFKGFIEKVELARKLIDKRDRLDRIQKTMEEAVALSESVKKDMAQGEIEFGAILVKRAELKTKYGSDPFQKALEEADKRLKDGARKVEAGDLLEARAKIVAMDQALFKAEVVGAGEFYLRDIETARREVSEKKAEKFLPKSYGQAVACREQLRDYIEKRPADHNMILAVVTTCSDKWSRLKNLLVFVESAKNQQWEIEDYVLFFDSKLDEITLAAGRQPDAKLTPLSKAANLKDYMKADQETVQKLKRETAEAQKRVAELLQNQDARSRELQEAKKSLEDKQVKEAHYRKVRALLGPNLADVKIDGNDIEIDLFGLTFKPGSLEVTSDAFPILEKVKKAVQLFKDKKIEVIGHTDAAGRPETNQKLSEGRARTVVKFLVSSGVVTPDEVQVRGMGAQKPLRPNTTSENRAKNRRVEIRIKEVV